MQAIYVGKSNQNYRSSDFFRAVAWLLCKNPCVKLFDEDSESLPISNVMVLHCDVALIDHL